MQVGAGVGAWVGVGVGLSVVGAGVSQTPHSTGQSALLLSICKAFPAVQLSSVLFAQTLGSSGVQLGDCVGVNVGEAVGCTDGCSVGAGVGAVGAIVGPAGAAVGLAVGSLDAALQPPVPHRTGQVVWYATCRIAGPVVQTAADSPLHSGGSGAHVGTGVGGGVGGGEGATEGRGDGADVGGIVAQIPQSTGQVPCSSSRPALVPPVVHCASTKLPQSGGSSWQIGAEVGEGVGVKQIPQRTGQVARTPSWMNWDPSVQSATTSPVQSLGSSAQVGTGVGAAVGAVGSDVGAAVGAVGAGVGAGVGSAVGLMQTPQRTGHNAVYALCRKAGPVVHSDNNFTSSHSGGSAPQVGAGVGAGDGAAVGEADGAADGGEVGAGVMHSPQSTGHLALRRFCCSTDP